MLLHATWNVIAVTWLVEGAGAAVISFVLLTILTVGSAAAFVVAGAG